MSTKSGKINYFKDDKNIEQFICALFPFGCKVIYYYKTKGTICNSDGVSSFTKNPKIDMVIQSIVNNELYRILLVEEDYGLNTTRWVLYNPFDSSSKVGLRLELDITTDKFKTYREKSNLPEKSINIFNDIRLINIYDGLNDKSLQCIHIAVDDISDIIATNDGEIEKIPNTLYSKCISLIERAGFKQDGFIFFTDDKKELIFEAIRQDN